ncbi:hypothetical protein PINS_up015659 [Pythium insidiosum]|nr:hypothetical protein PINS_up015659 [Pythium insidiosum]
MQELSTKELLKTVEDQLALTARSEEQLKLQTRQLMQQNQSLQADLLEKIAAETSKIQKMAHLSAEKQNLLEEMQRKEMQASQKAADGRHQLRSTVLRYVLRAQRRRQLQFALGTWRSATHDEATARRQALHALLRTLERGRIKVLARSFRVLHQNAVAAHHDEDSERADSRVAAADDRVRATSLASGLRVLQALALRRASGDIQRAFACWRQSTQHARSGRSRLELALAKLNGVMRGRTRTRVHHAMKTWLMNTRLQGLLAAEEMVKRVEQELADAKECVFTLSRAKTRLEEKLQLANEDLRRQGDQLREQRSELTLVKHGYVTTVVRSAERDWLRLLFRAWQHYVSVQAETKELRLQVEMAELRAEEREKYARSLDDYNKVLRNDLERFQFFSQDKRIAVDLLTKKLMREEEKVKHMEEQHVTLEEKLLAQKAQLASLLDWRGVTLPTSLLVTCRDAAVSHLHDSFHRFAASTSPPLGAVSDLRPGTSGRTRVLLSFRRRMVGKAMVKTSRDWLSRRWLSSWRSRASAPVSLQRRFWPWYVEQPPSTRPLVACGSQTSWSASTPFFPTSSRVAMKEQSVQRSACRNSGRRSCATAVTLLRRVRQGNQETLETYSCRTPLDQRGLVSSRGHLRRTRKVARRARA